MRSRRGLGWFFALAGVGLVIVGIVMLAGDGESDDGWVMILIGGIWAVIGVGVVSFYRGVERKTQEEARLFETGERATAVVENTQVTGTEINHNPVIELTLRVKPRSGAEFLHERRLCVPHNGVPLPGHLTEVAFDPNDHSKVALDVDERLAVPPGRYIRTRPPEAES